MSARVRMTLAASAAPATILLMYGGMRFFEIGRQIAASLRPLLMVALGCAVCRRRASRP